MLKTYLYIPEELNDKINTLVAIQKISKAEVMRGALREGLALLKRKRVGTAEALLKVAKLGKRYKVRGPKQASIKMDEYLWDKNWEENE